MKKSLVLCLAMLAAACAASDTSTVSGERPAKREYRTGSNVPIRENGGTVSDVRTIDRESMERTGAGEVPTSNTPGGSPGTR